MKKTGKKRAASKKSGGAKKRKTAGRASRKGSRLKKAERIAYRYGGED